MKDILDFAGSIGLGGADPERVAGKAGRWRIWLEKLWGELQQLRQSQQVPVLPSQTHHKDWDSPGEPQAISRIWTRKHGTNGKEKVFLIYIKEQQFDWKKSQLYFSCHNQSCGCYYYSSLKIKLVLSATENPRKAYTFTVNQECYNNSFFLCNQTYSVAYRQLCTQIRMKNDLGLHSTFFFLLEKQLKKIIKRKLKDWTWTSAKISILCEHRRKKGRFTLTGCHMLMGLLRVSFMETLKVVVFDEQFLLCFGKAEWEPSSRNPNATPKKKKKISL